MIGETMKCDSWFPCYPSDLISDTTRLRPHDFGAYWRLLCDYYQNGPLPDDDEDLRRISGVDPQDWARTKGKIMLFFQMNGDGKWHQKRADEVIAERNDMIARKKAQTVAARLANPKNFTTDPVTSSVTDSVTKQVTAVHPHPHPHPHPQQQRQPGGRIPLTPASRISKEKELERVEKRLEEVKQQGTQVAGSRMTYSVKQIAEIKTLKNRREQLKKELGFIA